MSLRIFSVGLSAALGACGAIAEDKVAMAAPGDRIDCATGRDTDFSRSCAIEKGNGTRLVLRHADGGFRQIDIAADGMIDAVDGSDQPGGEMMPDGRFELTLGSDRYRLPPRK